MINDGGGDDNDDDDYDDDNNHYDNHDLAEMVDDARPDGISKNVDRCAESEKKGLLGSF